MVRRMNSGVFECQVPYGVGGTGLVIWIARGVAVGRERNFQELLAVAFDHVRQIVVPDARVPFKIEMLEQQVDRAVAGEAGAPSAQIFAQQIFETPKRSS